MYQIVNCIDAGSEYCPCYLAETNECIMCSQLKGKVFCDCTNWEGVCIYQEYVFNQNRIKDRRKDYHCKVIEKEKIADGIFVLKIKVTSTLARELDQPGTYVFMRDYKYPALFETPMSIMEANVKEGTIKIAVQERGVKTKKLLELTEDVVLRGPYWNGLLGLKYIKSLQKGNALLVARGIGQAPALPVAKKLLQGKNKVFVILDKGRIDYNFVEDQFKSIGCQVVSKPVLNAKKLTIYEGTKDFIREFIVDNDISLLYSGGSDKFHEGLSGILRELKKNVFFTCSNDGIFCCGEGICGSCHRRLQDGTRIKTCKTQINPLEIFGRE
ncbi:MAG: sulfide/dihydroorotate dehydrogenase-like FAD/NAD-binding protein [Bacillota bacterium]